MVGKMIITGCLVTIASTPSGCRPGAAASAESAGYSDRIESELEDLRAELRKVQGDVARLATELAAARAAVLEEISAPSPWDKLKVGMTRQEVLDILGEPNWKKEWPIGVNVYGGAAQPHVWWMYYTPQGTGIVVVSSRWYWRNPPSQFPKVGSGLKWWIPPPD